MIVNRAALDGLFRNLRAEFNSAYGEAPVTWTDLATLINSMTAREDYRWFSRFPRMRKWVGERTVKSLAAFGYNVPNEKFETTIAVERDDLEDDILGIYAAQVRDAGIAAKLWPDELVYAALDNSFDAAKGKCHDGKAFFATDHPLSDAPAFSNKLTVRLRSDTLANAKASFGAARTMLQKMTDEEGRPMGTTADRLVVPPALEDDAKVLMMSNHIGEDANPYKGAAQVTVSPRLTSDTAWFLLHTRAALKPFIFQQRVAPELDQLTDPSQSERVFMLDQYLFGVRARGAAAYGLPQCAVGSDGSAA